MFQSQNKCDPSFKPDPLGNERLVNGCAVFAVVVLFGSVANNVWAQSKKPDGISATSKAAATKVAQEQRRNWVRQQIPKLVSDERERAEILGRLDDLNDDQVQELAIICLDELESRRKLQFAALREANARQRELEAQAIARLKAQSELASQQSYVSPHPYWAGQDYFGRRSYWSPRGYWSSRGYWGPPAYLAPSVGYIPVITWLPDGVSLSAQAVVSPDGRYVRTSVVPFFSTVGPVHTFNFMTGETRRYDR